MKFTSKLKIALIPPAIIILIAIVMSVFGMGLNMGLDFTGGTLVTLSMGQDFNVDDVKAAFAEQGITDVQIAKIGEGDQLFEASVRMAVQGDPEHELTIRQNVVEALKASYPSVVNSQTEHVGAVAGSDLVRNAVASVAMAGVLMLIYIAFRFELISGAVAILTMLHDIIIMVAFMVILRSVIQINSSFIAAMLTIVGYSINNVIIVFDRIRENRKRFDSRTMSNADVADKSIAETLGRTINTTITTLIVITLLYILGVDAVRQFALPIIIGLIGGFYSSLFLAGPSWAYWTSAESRRKAARVTAKKRKPARA